MVEHLKRHAASVDGVRLSDIPTASIAATLQAKAHKVGADLVVAGAFGHPELWEKLLGGVTHELLTHMKLPIMMSHQAESQRLSCASKTSRDGCLCRFG